jgi:hypothetical protein
VLRVDVGGTYLEAVVTIRADEVVRYAVCGLDFASGTFTELDELPINLF